MGDLRVPREVMEYYEVFGLAEEDIIEFHRERVLSIKTLAETMAELEALIKKFDGHSK